MATLDLDREESAMLREILDSYLGDLSMEIADTDSLDFRQKLKVKKAFIERLLGKL